MAMISICYVSSAVERLNQDQLINLLRECHENNRQHQITGMLLYNGFGTFIQVIEGEENEVDRLYANIRRDDRHQRVNLLRRVSVDQRDFPDWEMGFSNLDKVSPMELEGFSDFMQRNDQVAYLQTNRNFAFALLAHFKTTSRQLLK